MTVHRNCYRVGVRPLHKINSLLIFDGSANCVYFRLSHDLLLLEDVGVVDHFSKDSDIKLAVLLTIIALTI